MTTRGATRRRRAHGAAAAALALAVGPTACTDDSTADRRGDSSDAVTAPTSGAASAATTPADPTPETGAATTAPRIERSPAAGARCDPAAARADGATIRVWHSSENLAADLLRDLVERFETAHPGIDVVLEKPGGYFDGLDRLREADVHELPDLFMASSNDARLLVDSGLFVPPAACNEGRVPEVLADLLPLVEAVYTLDGELWAFPFNVSAPVLLYDRARMRAAGLDPDDPPRTPEELRAAAEQAIATGAATDGLVLFDGSAGWLVEQWAAQVGDELVEPENGVDGDVAGADVATAQAIEAAEWAREMYVDGLVYWADLNESGVDDLLKLINPEPALMTLHTSAALGDVVEVLEAGDFGGAELGVGPLPGPGTGSLVGGGGFWLVGGGEPAEIGAAAILGEWLMAPDQQGPFAAATGNVPATRSAAEHPAVLERWEEQPGFRVAYDQVADRDVTPAAVGMQVGPRVFIQAAIEWAMTDIIVGGEPAIDRLLEAEQDARDELAQYAADVGG
jgi:sn-glycerol 3-phosphate transport system substrate-binding protein